MPPRGRVGSGESSQQQVFVTESVVTSLYRTMIQALLSGRNYEDVLTSLIPFILGELDSTMLDHPMLVGHMVMFAEEYWRYVFPDIPSPDFKSMRSATEMYTAVKEMLSNYREKVVKVEGVLSESEIAEKIEYLAARFMDVIARRAFKFMGVLH